MVATLRPVRPAGRLHADAVGSRQIEANASAWRSASLDIRPEGANSLLNASTIAGCSAPGGVVGLAEDHGAARAAAEPCVDAVADEVAIGTGVGGSIGRC
jgi:hypothetical protein